MRHRTLDEIRNAALESGNFFILGAIDYIICTNTKFRCNQVIDEFEIPKFYDAKRIILDHDRFSFPKYSKKRDRADKKYNSALKQYYETDPYQDVPF